MSKGEKPILSVRIDADLLSRIDKLAELAGCGRAEVVERCVTLGLMNQEEMVEWLSSPVQGAVVQALMHPVIFKRILKLFGEVPDPTSMKLRDGVIERKKRRGKPATT